MRFAAIILALSLAISSARGQTTTTSPAADPPAPAAMAPTYVTIGEQLRLRLALFRRTLNDLSLDPAIKQRANHILDAADDDLKELLAEVRSGRMPGYHRLMTVPDRLRATRASLLAIIGPDQDNLLQEKLRSLRGEARNQLNWLHQQLSDLNLPDGTEHACEKTLAETETAVEKLPDTDIEGDQYANARAAMDKLFARAHDALADILNSDELTRLGPHFADLATRPPVTQPAPGS